MKRPVEFVFVVDEGFFRHLGCKSADRYVDRQELLSLVAKTDRLGPFAPYQLRYLFGVGAFEGLLRLLLSEDRKFTICEEGYFREHCGRFVKSTAHVDFQFARAIPLNIIRALLQAGNTVSGWCLFCLSGKHNQAALLDTDVVAAAMLPRQLYFARKEDICSLAAAAAASWFEEDILVAKLAYGSSGSLFPDAGPDPIVFRKENWPKAALHLTSDSLWPNGAWGLLISDLVRTCDPYLSGCNMAVHKVHVLCGLERSELNLWYTHCIRMPAWLDVSSVGDDMVPMRRIARLEPWVRGEVQHLCDVLWRLAYLLWPLPRLFCLDLMFRPDGQVAFLEANTNPATLAQSDLFGSECPLTAYIRVLFARSFNAEQQRTALEGWLAGPGRELSPREAIG